MGKFEFDHTQQIKVLSEEQVKTIHEKALYILENMGMTFAYEPALDYLEKAGCEVDRETQKVKFPKELMELKNEASYLK